MSADWIEKDNSLVCEFKFDTYIDGARFAMKVAQKADEIDHHPGILILYRKVIVTTTTHDAGNVVTELDKKLAEAIDTLV